MKVEIISEIGVNANGDMGAARALVDAAKEAGADVVKFQATYPRLEMSRRLMPDRIAMTEGVILTHDKLEQMASYCRDRHIEFLCTPSEETSLRWLIERVHPQRIKVGSDNLTNIPFLEQVASHGLPVILSTGMANEDEVLRAYDVFRGKVIPHDMVVMHCTSAYPCPIDQANIRALTTLKNMFLAPPRLGWSDHTDSPFLACAAVALGATVIEKHLTLDRRQAGPDHKASLDPLQFSTMVRLIRETEIGLGSATKRAQPCEIGNRLETRKSLVAACQIQAGEQFAYPGNIAIQRPGMGKSPVLLGAVVGKTAMRDYEEGELI